MPSIDSRLVVRGHAEAASIYDFWTVAPMNPPSNPAETIRTAKEILGTERVWLLHCCQLHLELQQPLRPTRPIRFAGRT